MTDSATLCWVLAALTTLALADDQEVTVILQPSRRAALSALVEGPIVEVAREEGEVFEEGEILVRIDDRLHRAAVDRFEALLAAARARHAAATASAGIDLGAERVHRARAVLDGARADLQSKESLFRTGSLSTGQIEAARTTVAVAAADLALAERMQESGAVDSRYSVESARIDISVVEAQLVEARALLERCVLRAPFAGRVEARHAQPAEAAAPGRPLADLIDDTTLLARCLIPSERLVDLKPGMVVPIRIQETGAVVEGVLTRIGARVDATSSTLAIAFRIDNSDRVLRAGMRGTADLARLAWRGD